MDKARREIPGYVAGYALHLAAAKIVLLAEALEEAKRYHEHDGSRRLGRVTVVLYTSVRGRRQQLMGGPGRPPERP